jgi:hypothetical protein
MFDRGIPGGFFVGPEGSAPGTARPARQGPVGYMPGQPNGPPPGRAVRLVLLVTGLQRRSPGYWTYLMPVVAIPLMRKRWPKRNTRKTGRSETMDIANSDPQLVADCESTKALSATGTVNMSGSVR